MQVRELQTELMVEQKKSEEYQKGVRRYERRCKELMYQVWSPHIVQLSLLSDVLLVPCSVSNSLWFSSCRRRRTGRLC